MTSLPKTMGNADLRETKQILYHSKRIDESYPKMYFLLNLSHYIKSYGHFCQILAFFYNARSPNMVMSRDQRSKFPKKNNFFLILNLTLGKVAKFLVGKLSTSEVISQEPQGGGGEWKAPPRCTFQILGVAGSEDFTCTTLPTTPLDFSRQNSKFLSPYPPKNRI